jgi:hypothetical protein
MISPSIFSLPVVDTSEKCCLFLAVMLSCEDSGCLILDAGQLRITAFSPFDEKPTIDDVEAMIDCFIEDGRIWPYYHNGKRYGFVPLSPVWNKSLNNRYSPSEYPLPPGVIFVADDSSTHKNRTGRGKYIYPHDPEELVRERTDVGEFNL